MFGLRKKLKFSAVLPTMSPYCFLLSTRLLKKLQVNVVEIWCKNTVLLKSCVRIFTKFGTSTYFESGLQPYVENKLTYNH